jgi:hypothetical protein
LQKLIGKSVKHTRRRRDANPHRAELHSLPRRLCASSLRTSTPISSCWAPSFQHAALPTSRWQWLASCSLPSVRFCRSSASRACVHPLRASLSSMRPLSIFELPWYFSAEAFSKPQRSRQGGVPTIVPRSRRARSSLTWGSAKGLEHPYQPLSLLARKRREQVRINLIGNCQVAAQASLPLEVTCTA